MFLIIVRRKEVEMSRYQKLLKLIKNYDVKMKEKTDDDLKSSVFRVKEIIKTNEFTMITLAEAFALVREVNWRLVGLYPTEEQVYAAVLLYFGIVTEMKTGEGKSLVATMTLYLKALSEETVFLVTTNDYLAKRDYQKFKIVYEWLGLSVACGTSEKEEEYNFSEKKRVYSSNIVYISNATLGFDYLIDGLAKRNEEKFMAPLRYALLDEVDEILLDSAQIPLIISGGAKVQSNYFNIANDFIETLEYENDFTLDEERANVWLTSKGLEKAKHYFSTPKLLTLKYYSLYQHIILALKAHFILQKGKDYLVEGGIVKLLDNKDGRVLDGTNLQSGLHQAVEAKEGVELTSESQIISSITYQNLFRQFKQISGMSGTVKISESEFIETYNLTVKRINSRKKNIRKDYPPQIFVTFKAKIEAVLEKIKEIHASERPILIITDSLNTSELISMHLLNMGVAHTTLNAKSSVKEAQIIKEAGSVGAVTVSTAMAGRGTDIKITPEALEKGGLAVIITERMSNKRIELQAKGRAGRQGEPGSTYTYESLEDTIVKAFIQENVQRYYYKRKEDAKPIRKQRIRHFLDRAQKLSEDRAYNERRKALQFDEVLRIQKQHVDKSRQDILSLENIPEALNLVIKIFEETIKEMYDSGKLKSSYEIRRYILDNVDYNFKNLKSIQDFQSKNETIEFLKNHIKNIIRDKKLKIVEEQVFLQYLKITILKAIDSGWSKEVDALNQLRIIVQSRTSAQKKPILEYEKEAINSYNRMRREVKKMIIRNVALSLIEVTNEELTITFP